MRSPLPALFLIAASIATARESGPAAVPHETSREQQEAIYRQHVLKVLEGVRYREGVQELPGGFANLHLPEGFRYLDPEDSRKVVVDLWGNPPASAADLLGIIVPAGEHLAVSTSWSIVLSYADTGHVSDDEADEIDHDKLLGQLMAGSRQSNDALEAAGFETMALTGWAVEPRYDPVQKVLYWAKRFKIDSHSEETLNYDVRILGRSGVVSLNAVSCMGRVADIEAATPAVVSMLRFNPGHRYSDFDPATDKTAAFPLSGLVLGGPVAPAPVAKSGIPAHLGKIAIVGGVGLVLLLRRLLGGGRNRP